MVSFFSPPKPRDFFCSTTTCCVHHGFRQTFDTWNFGRIPQLWNRHIRLQTRLHKLHLIYTFLGKNSPWLTHESAWQNSHCYGTICQATILWVFFLFISLLTIFILYPYKFPQLRSPLSNLFQSKLCNHNSSKKNLERLIVCHLLKDTLSGNTIHVKWHPSQKMYRRYFLSSLRLS